MPIAVSGLLKLVRWPVMVRSVAVGRQERLRGRPGPPTLFADPFSVGRNIATLLIFSAHLQIRRHNS